MKEPTSKVKASGTVSESSMQKMWGEKVRQSGFSQIPNVITQYPKLLHSAIKPTHIALLMNLLSRYNGDKRLPFPSFSKIARDIGCTQKTAWKTAMELEAMEILTITRRSNQEGVKKKSNLYSFEKLRDKVQAIAERQSYTNNYFELENIIYSLFNQRYNLDHRNVKKIKEIILVKKYQKQQAKKQSTSK